MKQLFDQKDNQSNFSEQFLRLDESRFRLLVSGVKDFAIFMLDGNGHILTWNEGAKRLKGYDEHEIIGKHISVFYSEDDRKNNKPWNGLIEAIKHGQYEAEDWRYKKNGERFWASVVITRMNDEKGNLIGFSKVTRDLTERKMAEEKHKEVLRELRHTVERKTADLAAALVARDEFLMIASHELKTPLTSLKLRLQMGKRNLRPEINKIPTKDELEKFYLQSLEQVDSLVNLVDELLEVSRLQSGHFTLNKNIVNLSKITEAVTARFIEQKNIAVDIAPDLYVEADAYRMNQVLSNLLSNAFKHAPKAKVQVKLEKSSDEKFIMLLVQDNGPGIEIEKQESIFQRFERLGSYTHVGGLGLGLYIVKKIVEGHGGEITLSSAPGNGSTFTIKLPLVL